MLTHTSEHRILSVNAAAMPLARERMCVFLRSPEASPEAFQEIEQTLTASGMPAANVNALMTQLRSKINASTNRPSTTPATTPATGRTPAAGVEPHREDDESPEDAQERISAGRSFEQQAQQADVREAAMIGAGLGVLPASAYLSQTLPAMYALGGATAASSMLTLGAPVAGGMLLGHHLGRRLGHPMMGTFAGTVGGTALGYGALQLVPQVAALNTTLTGWGTALGGIGYWSTLPLAAGGMALGYTLGKHIIPGEKGGLIGAGIGTAVGGGVGAAATYFGGLATVAPYIPSTLGLVGLPLVAGAYIGNKWIGGKTGGAIGGLTGAALGGSMWWLSSTGGAAGVAATAPGWFPVLAGAAVPAAAAGALYLGGKVHQLVWGTPQNVGTWGMLGRAVASPITLPARVLNFAHELAWGTPMAKDLQTQIIRGIGGVVSAPAGLLWNRLGVGALAGGLWRGLGEKYEAKHSGFYGALEWLGSRPGQLIRSIASIPGGTVEKGKGLFNWLFEKKSS